MGGAEIIQKESPVVSEKDWTDNQSDSAGVGIGSDYVPNEPLSVHIYVESEILPIKWRPEIVP